MRPAWKEYLSYYIIAFLAILALSLVSCTKPVPVTAVWPMKFNSSDGAAAHTTCDMRGNPIILINEEMFQNGSLPVGRWVFILIHEEKHVEQIRRIKGGCREAHRLYTTDKDFRLDSELEAYCWEFNAMLREDLFVNRDNAYRTLVQHLFKAYGQHLSWKEFEERVPCRRSP